MTIVSIVTGATRNLGLHLAHGLARRLGRSDIVYLTGRDEGRVADAVRQLSDNRAEVRGEVLDVSDRDSIEAFAGTLADRHGGIDVMFSNHYSRVQPDDDPARVIDGYVAANNLGTTHLLRS